MEGPGPGWQFWALSSSHPPHQRKGLGETRAAAPIAFELLSARETSRETPLWACAEVLTRRGRSIHVLNTRLLGSESTQGASAASQESRAKTCSHGVAGPSRGSPPWTRISCGCDVHAGETRKSLSSCYHGDRRPSWLVARHGVSAQGMAEQ